MVVFSLSRADLGRNVKAVRIVAMCQGNECEAWSCFLYHVLWLQCCPSEKRRLQRSVIKIAKLQSQIAIANTEACGQHPNAVPMVAGQCFLKPVSCLSFKGDHCGQTWNLFR